MKKLISKLKDVPDLESKHPWSTISQNYNSTINENVNSVNHFSSSNFSHLNNFINKKFNIGRFVVIVEEIIAEGGFGLVFKVKSQNDHIFALKRLCVNNKNDLKVCKREITIMSSLTHKNILSLIDYQINEQHDGVYEILMLLAYCPKNVTQLMQSKQKVQQHLPENVIVKILCDIIEAVARLHYCHTPVIHRDLKVENILIDERNNYVLCDFGSATARQIIPNEYGIAKTEEEISKYTTLAYRSPEMVLLGNQIVNCKSDIWALGCLLYYLCYFTLPFGDRVLAIQSGRFTIPKTDVVYSDKILKLIQYMLTVDPVERPSIYQVSVLAFSIANKKCPIQNLDKEKVPQWDDLELPNSVHTPQKSASDIKSHHTTSATRENDSLKTTANSSTSRSKSVVNQSRTISTSINPRNRPRANKPVVSKSESNDNFHDKLDEKSVANISQSNSFNISLSNAKSNPSKNWTETSNHSMSTVVPQDPQNSNTDQHEDVESNIQPKKPPRSELKIEKSNDQKTRFGHRRMVSETSLKAVVEENLKSGSSLLELPRKDSTDSAGAETENLQPVNIKINDEIENDASFGEEFDKIRHESGASVGTD